jgi:branched-chain amino acid transport system ATP-binding protein
VSVAILAVENLSRRFGGVHAVKDVSLEVRKGELRAIIGPNGAGKSTLFGLLTGQLRPDSGRVLFMGADVTGRAPHVLCRRGLGRTFQINSIFVNATVLENVQLALLAHRGRIWNMFSAARNLFVREAQALLEMLGLAREAGKPGSALSYGDRRRLEVALALACEPQVLLLDEPTAGMSVSDKPRMVGLIRDIVREKGVTAVLIEHDMDIVFSVADRITVMHQGGVLAEGRADDIRANARVQEIYLGAPQGA